jgi:predicted aspartyl protease
MNTQIPLQVISIQERGFHILLKIKINGMSARMVLDTGASQTVLDKNRVHRFVDDKEFEKNETLSTGLGTNSMESHIVHIRKMQLGDLIIKDSALILLDLSIVNTSYEQIGMKPLDGIIGSDILMMHKAVIDFGKRILKLKGKA